MNRWILDLGLNVHICNSKAFGNPLRRDCGCINTLMKGFPLHPRPEDLNSRLFVEPQYTDPPFSDVPNPYDVDIVQVPKIWRYGEYSIGEWMT